MGNESISSQIDPAPQYSYSGSDRSGLLCGIAIQERSPNIDELKKTTNRDIYAEKIKEENRHAKMVIIEFPITMDFSVTRSPLLGSNKVMVRIYNLATGTRERISRYKLADNPYRYVEFKAGYRGSFNRLSKFDDLPTIARGYLNACTSTKEGTDIITTVEFYGCFEMLQREQIFANDVAAIGSISQGTSFTKAIALLVQMFDKYDGRVKNVRYSALAKQRLAGLTFPKNLSPDKDVLGQIEKILAGRCKIQADGPQMYIIANEEYINGSDKVNVITSESGLLSVPVLEAPSIISFEMVFEPRVMMHQQIGLSSEIASQFISAGLNSKAIQGKIISIIHTGVISGSVTSKVTTKINMFVGELRDSLLEVLK